MHSFIFYSGTDKARKEKIGEYLKNIHLTEMNRGVDFKDLNEPDFLHIGLTEKSIGINEIREITQRMSVKPLKWEKRVVLFESANRMTLPAQHAILKILEEPPQNSIIILELENPNLLLPTIISRCQLISVEPKPELQQFNNEGVTKELNSILSMKHVADRLNKLNELASQYDVTEILKLLLNLLRIEMKRDPKISKLVHHIEDCRLAVDQNINRKLIIEHCAIHAEKVENTDELDKLFS